MTKQDVIRRIARQTGLDPDATRFVVETFFEVVQESLTQGKPIYMRGFGSFILRQRAGKTARNIKANTAVLVPPHVVPLFKPSPEFVDQVKGRAKQADSA